MEKAAPWQTLIGCFFFLSPLYAQKEVDEDNFASSTQNKGAPFIKNYAAKNYDAGTQNFCVLQDKRGILYFGNNSGVLEFDGLANHSEVHALTMDETGRIYLRRRTA
jgi:hypothetical protein